MSMSGEAAAIRDGLIFALSVVSGNRRGELRNLPIKDLQIALNHPAHALNHSPHSGDRVIRAYYYNPDIARADKATASAFKVMA